MDVGHAGNAGAVFSATGYGKDLISLYLIIQCTGIDPRFHRIDGRLIQEPTG
jgi:hypothetical protein